MKNKHGQVLVSFIILLPVILIALASIIEYGMLEYNKIRYTSITKSVIANNIEDKEKDKINELLNENGISDAIVTIDDGITIKFIKKENSYLGKIINKDSYDININIKGYITEDKIIYKKGS